MTPQPSCFPYPLETRWTDMATRAVIVTKDFPYLPPGGDDPIVVPAGTESDFTSTRIGPTLVCFVRRHFTIRPLRYILCAIAHLIGAVVEAIFPQIDEGALAAVVHDYLYRTGKKARGVADMYYREGMLQSGVPWWKAEVKYIAVRMFGWMAYKQGEVA